ncbi:AAA family ATPase [Stella sp.]|uniref:bifunctional aminoglycoside phosphotransferase/ATP-binding protein n=1 Tax=Stella sp. TaxID=2912054 RepID=UPI0035B024AB
MAGANAEAGETVPPGEEGQRAVRAMLADPATHDGAAVRQVRTHAAIVFLAGDRAWKLKRAVRFPYLDFSTVERRRIACEAEIRLNRRTAPEIYERVVPVTRGPDGRPRLGGEGPAVDWLVAMRRFDETLVLDRLADAGRIDLATIEALADHVAAFHAAAERRPDRGGLEAMRFVVDTNAEALADAAAVLDQERSHALTAATRAALEAVAPLLERRRREGFVRLGHGDLHLGNICLVDGRPRLFDALEFDLRLTCLDTVYDIAFLVMDLLARGLVRAANRFVERYVERTGDVAGLALLPLCLSMRAAIRAHVSVAIAAGAADPGEHARAARRYLDLAHSLLAVRPPRLVAVGGLSGSGKSTVARALAPWIGAPPGALVLRSDVVRKRLLGLDPAERAGTDAYRPEVSDQVYAALRREAAVVLAAGRTVVVDAVHARPEERDALQAVAQRLGVPFHGIWLDAPEPTLVARVEARRGDVSDATAAVVRHQLGYQLGPLAWRRVATGAGFAAVAGAVAAALALDDAAAVDMAQCHGASGT